MQLFFLQQSPAQTSRVQIKFRICVVRVQKLSMSIDQSNINSLKRN